MKKLLLVVVAASSMMQANVFEYIPSTTWHAHSVTVDLTGHSGSMKAAGYYAMLNAGLRHYNVREGLKAGIESKVSSRYASFVAAHLSLACVDATAMTVSCLAASQKDNYSAFSVGTLLARTTMVNATLAGAEELAKKNETAKSFVESSFYQSLVRPVAQMTGATLLSKFI